VVVLERPALPGDEWFVCNLLTCERTQLQGPSSGEWSLAFDAAEPYAALLSDESGESLWVPELQLLSVYVDDEGKRFVRNRRTGKVRAWEEHVAWNIEVSFKIRIGATMTELDKEWRAAVLQCQRGCRVWRSLTDLYSLGTCEQKAYASRWVCAMSQSWLRFLGTSLRLGGGHFRLSNLHCGASDHVRILPYTSASTTALVGLLTRRREACNAVVGQGNDSVCQQCAVGDHRVGCAYPCSGNPFVRGWRMRNAATAG